MPELPEVETIRIGLQKHLVGHTIRDVVINLPKQISGDTNTIIGAQILSVKRLGKGLILELSNGYSITIHVKMTGQLLYLNPKLPKQPIAGNAKVILTSLPDKYTHIIFHFDQDALLFYRDVRQFGWIRIVKSDSVASEHYFKNLGPEPLKDLTLTLFQTILSKRKTPIKQLLMDQSAVAGVGNIYANDALFVAGIHPQRPANSLSASEQKKLFVAVEQVLQKGIEVGGASEWSYVDALGKSGRYQEFFQVYRKNGQKCPRCGTEIETIRLSGRGTFFCQKCQR
jgi:formamidopyrimidine-DNA glycosylase